MDFPDDRAGVRERGCGRLVRDSLDPLGQLRTIGSGRWWGARGGGDCDHEDAGELGGWQWFHVGSWFHGHDRKPWETCGNISSFPSEFGIPNQVGSLEAEFMNGSFLVLAESELSIPLAGAITIGRQQSNKLVLTDEQVSRQHALIQWQRTSGDEEAGGYLLIDLGSSNGTFLNRTRISRPMPLRNGDLIEIGSHAIEFRSSGDTEISSSDTIGSTVLDIKKRQVWLMVGDIMGSTRRSRELPAEEVPRINGTWFKTCRELVENHGGHMNQYLGDGFLCYWEDTLEAKHGLPALLRTFVNLQQDASPPFRIVLHFGTAVLGSVPTLSTLNLHGPNVNFVFRMEKLAGSLRLPLLLSEEAASALRLETISLHRSELAGFDGLHGFVVPRLPKA
jgi:pSer/pThr/pTyr-binding forkhead associated (FHA) protein